MKKLLLFLGLCGLAARLLALSPAPYTEGVSFSFRLAGTGNGTMTIYGEGSSPAVTHSVAGTTSESPTTDTAWLRPGQEYRVNFQGSGASEYWMSYVAPTGYTLFIDRKPGTLSYSNTGGGSYSDDYMIQLQPEASLSAADFGSFSGIDLGKSVTWEIGLGRLHDGRSAGRIIFKQSDLTNSPANRDRLYYSPPMSYGETWLFYDGPSSQRLRQVLVPQGMVDIVDDGVGGYFFKLYTPADVEGSPGNPSILHNSPWRTIHVESPSSDQLRVTDTEGGVSRISLVGASSSVSGTYTWTLQEGDVSGWVRTTEHNSSTTTISGVTYRDVVVTTRTGGSSGTIVGKSKYRYTPFAWGEELTQVIADPDTAALTKTLTYYTNASDWGNFRRLKSVTEATGNWTAWQYYDDWDRRGQLKYKFSPYLNAPATVTLDPAQGTVSYFEYAADWTGRYTRPTLLQESVNNTVTGKTVSSYSDIVGFGWPRETVSSNRYRDASNYHTDYVERFRMDAGWDFPGMPYQQYTPDQAKTVWSQEKGDYNLATRTFTVGAGYQWRQISIKGSTTSTGADYIGSWDGHSFIGIHVLANRSTMDVLIKDLAGNTVRTETWVYTGSGSFARVAWEDFVYDQAGRLYLRVASNGATTANTYANGRLMSTIDPTGVETQFTYDGLDRVLTSVKKGVAASGSYAAQGDVTTTYTYDGMNHITQTVVSGGALSLTTSAAFDLAGRPTSATVPGSPTVLTTTYAYTSGGKIVTANLPDTATKITETYLDGQAKSVTGTAVVSQVFTYGVESGSARKYVQTVVGGETQAAITAYADWLGRKVEEKRPAWTSGTTVSQLWFYNASGQLWKYTQPGLANTLYVYDTLGVRTQDGLDINGNDALDAASNDRIVGYGGGIYTYDSGVSWWSESHTYTYATASSGTVTNNTSQRFARLNGLATNCQSEVVTKDIFGNSTTSTITVDRTAKKVTASTDTPDSNVNAVQISYNGLLMESTDTTNLKTTFGYDALGRPVTSVDPRKGTTTTAYKSGSSQVDWVKDPANVAQATYTYEAGRVKTVTDALGKVSRFDYNARGQTSHEWGDTGYPVEHLYDNSGRQTEMHTYRGGTGWTASAWPSGTVGTADATYWTFHARTGLLQSKTDAQNHSVNYTYTQAGQIATRTWARGVSTTYAYSGTTGELLTVDYSDSTPDLTFTYNRLGQQSTVSDVTGTRTFTYNLGGTLELQNEILPYGFWGDWRITRGYDTASGVVGRYNHLGAGSASSPYGYDVSYGFDSKGRLNTTWLFGYTYTANSNLIASTSYSGWNFTDTRTYDATHDWIDSRVITGSSPTPPKASFAYDQDAMGRITAVNKTGDLFNVYGDGAQGLATGLAYNDRSELTTEFTLLGGTPTVLTGRNDSYSFDNIGNRTGFTHNSNTALYTANNLNQYTQRTVPGIFDVAGSAAAAATVTVNSSSSGVYRHGPYFFDSFPMSNNPNAAYNSSLPVSDGTTTTNLTAFVAGTPEAMTYDNDGNLLTDGRWSYTYDAENRLMAMETNVSAITDPGKRKLEFKYDYLGRRVYKLVRTFNGTSYTTVETELKFTYDGWNVIWEGGTINATSVTRAYVWGLDLSGTFQGAGGVGGLLAAFDSTVGEWCAPVYDGMGNIHAMLKSSNGSITAAFEYDAFGRTLRESETNAGNFPFRYSTKYTDIETSLVYYGLRYYCPSLGRFINKDPIEEKGGLNLYAFCANNGVNKWDVLGQHGAGDQYRDQIDYYNNLGRDLTQEEQDDLNYSQSMLGQIDAYDISPNAGYTRPSETIDAQYFYRSSSSLSSFYSAAYTLGVSGAYTESGKFVHVPAGTTTQDFDDGGKYANGMYAVPTANGSMAGVDATAAKKIANEVVAATIDGSYDYLLAQNNSRGPASRPPNPFEIEMGLMRRINRERDPVRRDRLQSELEVFRTVNNIRPPVMPSDLEFRAPGSPPTIAETLARIARQDLGLGRNDGRVFENRPDPNTGQRPLPPNVDPSYYREYVNPVSGFPLPGRERIIIGGNGEIYYSPNHYEPPIIPNPPRPPAPPTIQPTH